MNDLRRMAILALVPLSAQANSGLTITRASEVLNSRDVESLQCETDTVRSKACRFIHNSNDETTSRDIPYEEAQKLLKQFDKNFTESNEQMGDRVIISWSFHDDKKSKHGSISAGESRKTAGKNKIKAILELEMSLARFRK